MSLAEKRFGIYAFFSFNRLDAVNKCTQILFVRSVFDYLCTGFAFEGEFVSDFPYCLDGDMSEVSIEADMPCEVRVISGQELQALFDNDPKMAKMDVKILKNLFKMVYARDLDHYRYTARSRYRRLLERCPQVVQMLSLKDIASFLNVTPVYLSKIRKEITFAKEK